MILRALMIAAIAGSLLSACAGGGAAVGGNQHGVRGGISGTLVRF